MWTLHTLHLFLSFHCQEEMYEMTLVRTNYYTVNHFLLKRWNKETRNSGSFSTEKVNIFALTSTMLFIRQKRLCMQPAGMISIWIRLCSIQRKCLTGSWQGSVIYLISTSKCQATEINGAIVAFLLGVKESTYFQDTNFTLLQYCGKGSGQGMLACLLAILKGNNNTDLLDTILKAM